MGVDANPSELDRIFAALSHPTRRRIIEQLAAGDSSVGRLARPFRVSLPAISRHLKILERAGLLTVTPEWRVRRCHVEGGPMKDAFGWLTQYRVLWEERFDRLDEHLESMKRERGDRGGAR